jgi:hypothetical protein
MFANNELPPNRQHVGHNVRVVIVQLLPGDTMVASVSRFPHGVEKRANIGREI